jgi:Co/Zn/Cd efflux system component
MSNEETIDTHDIPSMDIQMNDVIIEVPHLSEPQKKDLKVDELHARKLRKEAKRLQSLREYKSNLIRLIVMMVLVFIVMGVELGVGIAANSLALLSDAFHMLSDFMGLIIGAVAMSVSLLSFILM